MKTTYVVFIQQSLGVPIGRQFSRDRTLRLQLFITILVKSVHLLGYHSYDYVSWMQTEFQYVPCVSANVPMERAPCKHYCRQWKSAIVSVSLSLRSTECERRNESYIYRLKCDFQQIGVMGSSFLTHPPFDLLFSYRAYSRYHFELQLCIGAFSFKIPLSGRF